MGRRVSHRAFSLIFLAVRSAFTIFAQHNARAREISRDFMSLTFTLQHTAPETKARAGEIQTDHGVIHPPIFMPVGTAATVKGLFHRDVKQEAKAEIILANTYHLYLRPGTQILEQAGGVHRFSSWEGPMLTDSGGFQVFSLSQMRKVTEDGVEFASFIDGSRHFISPEKSMDIQKVLGSDIIMAFDECTASGTSYKKSKEASDRTYRWLQRCYEHTKDWEGQALFPIVQGNMFEDLRLESLERTIPFAEVGIAIGGLSVGEEKPIMYRMLDVMQPHYPKDKPRYLMGVGTPANLLEAISRGVDMFDCVMPTRNGRNGMLFTSEGIINIKNEKWKYDFSPLDENGTTYVDRDYTKAYLRHLIISKEILGPMIATIHNLGFYLWLVKEARKHIIEGDFASWRDMMLPKVTRRI